MFYIETFSSFAFIATITVLADISTAPSAGLKTIPHEYKTPAASGIAITL
jgi:4-hydroxybenzoate polyprenyltransferase